MIFFIILSDAHTLPIIGAAQAAHAAPQLSP